jgi:SAM-dependent methyltransferase
MPNGFFANRIQPALLDLMLRGPLASREREAVVAEARGLVLEVGIGSGLSLRGYGPAVEALWGVDPSQPLLARATQRAVGVSFPVRLLLGAAERLPFDAETFDTVVFAWTLCSVGDPRRALEEARRVARTDGRLLFVEHGRAPDAAVRRWQDRLTPLWQRLAGGCHLNRPVDELVEGAGWRLERIERAYLEGPKPFTFRYRGEARQADRPATLSC